MPKFLTVILLLTLALKSIGQQVSIDTLYVYLNNQYTNNQTLKMKFPIIKTGSIIADYEINKSLVYRFTDFQYPNQPTDSSSIKWGGDQLIFLGFEVTLMTNDLISLNISAESCRAHCSGFTKYFNYSTITGQLYMLDDIVHPASNFRYEALSARNGLYEKQFSELKMRQLDTDSKLDDETYNWILENYKECSMMTEFYSFALYPDYLEIIDDCNFPYAIKDFEPVVELKYKYSDIAEILRIKLR